LLPKSVPAPNPVAGDEVKLDEEFPVAEHVVDADDIYEPNEEEENAGNSILRFRLLFIDWGYGCCPSLFQLISPMRLVSSPKSGQFLWRKHARNVLLVVKPKRPSSCLRYRHFRSLLLAHIITRLRG